MSTLFIYIFGLILAFSAYETAGSCDDFSCGYGEKCEPSLGVDGKCMKDSDRVTCSSMFYCYRPTTCCGFMSCCPEGSYCKNTLCYSDGSSDSEFGSSSAVTWTRYVGIVCGALAVVFVMIGVCVKVSRSRRAQQANGGAAAMAAVNSPYSTGPAAQQPPPYTVAASNPSAPYGGQPAPYGGQPSAYSNTNYKTEYSNAGFSDPAKI